MSSVNTVLNSAISVAAGDDIDVARTVLDVPPNQTLSKAWLTVKANLSKPDPGLLQKTIISLVTPDGQITDTGSSGTGALLFQLSNADTLLIPAKTGTPYDIKVLTSAGKIYTVEQGLFTPVPRVTDATS